MKSRAWIFAPFLLAGIWRFAFEHTGVYAWQDLPPQTDGQQFRIILGLKDAEPRTWQGKVEVTGGEIVGLAGWRFSMQDRANNDGTFNFITKMQPLEDQLRQGSYFGQTEMAGQPAPRQISEGLLLKIRGSGSARVRLTSGSNRLEFATTDIAYGSRVLLLDGNASLERLPVERRISDPGSANDQPAATVASDGTVWTAWVAYRDKSDVVMASDGRRAFSIGERGDLHAPAIAAGTAGEVHVAWPRNDDGVFHLYGSIWREGAWSRPERLTAEKGNDVWPRMAGDGKGNIAMVWQVVSRRRESVMLCER